MAGEARAVSIEELIASGAILAHKDGNYGSSYPRVEDFGTEGVPFLTAKSLREGYVDIAGAPRLGDARADELTFGFVQTDDVLLSHNATIGRVAVVPQHKGRLLVGTSLTYFRLNPEKLLPRYLAVYFAGAEFQNQLVAVMSHSTRNQVPVTAQRKLHVVVPPLAEQKAIAAVLGALDDKIELNRRMNATLEAMARALFQSWFVDFDPVRAKLDGRQPSGMDAVTASLFPDAFRDSDLGHIPIKWGSARLDEVTEFIVDSEHKTASTQETGVPCIRTTNIRNGRLDLVGSNKVSEETYQEWTRRAEPRGFDLILTREAPVGDVGAVPPHTRVCLGQRTVLIRPDVSKVHPLFLLQLLQCRDVRFELECRAEGSVVPHLNMADIRKFMISLPPLSLQNAFGRQVEAMFLAVDQNERESATLGTLRDTLLPKLLSGEISTNAVGQ